MAESYLYPGRLSRRLSDASWRTSGDGEDPATAAVRPVTPRTWAATTAQRGRSQSTRISLYSNSLFSGGGAAGGSGQHQQEQQQRAGAASATAPLYIPLSHRASLPTQQRPSTAYPAVYGGGPSIASAPPGRPSTAEGAPAPDARPGSARSQPHAPGRLSLLSFQAANSLPGPSGSSQQALSRGLSNSLRPLSPPALNPIPTPALAPQRSLRRPVSASLPLGGSGPLGPPSPTARDVEREPWAGARPQHMPPPAQSSSSSSSSSRPQAPAPGGPDRAGPGPGKPAPPLKEPKGVAKLEVRVDARGLGASDSDAERGLGPQPSEGAPSPSKRRLPGKGRQVAGLLPPPEEDDRAASQSGSPAVPAGGGGGLSSVRPATAPATPQGVMDRGLASVYDPNLEEQDPGRRVQRRDPAIRLAPQASVKSTALEMRSFLMHPGPGTGPIQCFIIRDRRRSRLYPSYTLYLDVGHKFLLAARKRKKSSSANYLMSLDEHDLARHSSSFCGKVRGNFLGTGFAAYTRGAKPGRDAQGAAKSELRQELAAVAYAPNFLGSKGPRRMSAIIPGLDPAGRPTPCQPARPEETLRERCRAGDRGGLVVMENKPPRWNAALRAYCLNFGGRVTHASVKNFQLVAPTDDPEHVILQFGKVGTDTFTMDYQAPISALQAFAICLTALDNKLACDTESEESEDHASQRLGGSVTQSEVMDALLDLEETGQLRGESKIKTLESQRSYIIPPVRVEETPQPECLRSEVPSKFGSGLSLKAALQDSTFFVTGGTGYVGSVVVEQLLRLFPLQVKKIYLLVRAKRGQSGEERIDSLLSRKALFASLLVDGKLPPELRAKLAAIPGDTTAEGLGISSEDRRMLEEEVDFVIHSAASISFFDHIHILLQQNYFATEKVVQLAKGCRRLRGFIHVSTAYVNANLPRGTHIEEHIYPLKHKSRVLPHASTAAHFESLPPAKAEKEAQQLLKDLGLPNGYTLTKHWAEDLVAEAHGPAFPVAIVRPSIVGALAGAPLPGYFGNAAGLTSATLAFATGMARFTCHNPFSVYDIIPCDLVGHTILACCAVLTEASAGTRPPTVIQACSGTSHPVSFAESMRRIVLPYWSQAPPKYRLTKKAYKAIEDRLAWVDYNSTLFKMLTAQGNLRVGAVATAARLAGHKKVADLIKSSWAVWQLYNVPAMDFELFYCCRVLRQLEAALDPAERSALGLKLVWTKDDEWWPYIFRWQEVIREKYYPDTLEAAAGFQYNNAPNTPAEVAMEERIRERGPERMRNLMAAHPSPKHSPMPNGSSRSHEAGADPAKQQQRKGFLGSFTPKCFSGPASTASV